MLAVSETISLYSSSENVEVSTYLQKTIDKFTKQQILEQKEQIKSFVKIYENMPPKNAAIIFNDMDIDLLVQIISNMKEIKASSILAHMDVKKIT